MSETEYHSYVLRVVCQHPGLAPNEALPDEIEKVGVISTSLKGALRLLGREHPQTQAREWEVVETYLVTNPDYMKECVVYTQNGYERPPLVTANLLYDVSLKSTPEYERLSSDIFDRVDFYQIAEGANKRVSTRQVSYEVSTRVHCIDAVWFDGKPIAIYQVSGRPDFSRLIVTDVVRYSEAEAYLKTLECRDPDDEPSFLIIDPDIPDRRLNHFYSRYANVEGIMSLDIMSNPS